MNKALAHALVIPLVVVIVAGATFYFVDSNASKKQDKLNNQIVALQSQSQKTQPVVSDNTVATTKTDTPTATSTTYTDKDMKFSFTLPANYKIFRNHAFEGGEAVILNIGTKTDDTTSENTYIEITYYGEGTDFNDLKTSTESQIENDITSSKAITINGQNGYRYEVGGMSSGYKYIAAKGTNYVTINQYPSQDPAVIDSIVNSFKFGN